MSTLKNDPASDRAFTLIELLVSVAIIAILIAILLPVLGRTKDSALQVKCLNNLRQIHTALVNYAYEHDDHFPTQDDIGGWPYRVAPGKTSGIFSRDLPETYGLAALLDQGDYLPADSDFWVCTAHPLEQQAYGNTYAYHGESPRNRKSVDHWLSQTDSKAWMVTDNFRFKPWSSGWVKARGESSSGFTHARKDRWSPHPMTQGDKQAGDTSNNWAINILYRGGNAALYEYR